MTATTPRARTAGFFWLMTIVAGSIAAFAGEGIVVAGDAARTAANILAHEPMFRLGLAANIVATACYLAATVLVYALLKPVNRNVSLLAAFFSLVGCASSAVTFLLYLAPLIVLKSLTALAVNEVQALALLFVRLSGQAFFISHIFFGLHCLLVGCLILRSTFLNRIVGALMVFGGLGWMTMSFSNLLSPPLARALSPWILFPGILGEASLTLWLLVFGVNVQRWNEQAVLSGERA